MTFKNRVGMTFKEQLEHSIEGEVYFDAVHKSVYSVDASIYEVIPTCVVLPKNKKDLINAVNIARVHKVPVTARGAATGITGGCLGKGMIIDTSKYLTTISNIDLEHELVTCQPGVVQDTLNATLAPYGYRLGPDTSTGNRATIGGMVSNNAAGAHSLLFGTMREHIVSIELILSCGEVLRFNDMNEEEVKNKCLLNNIEGRIYSEICRIGDEYRQDIDHCFPKMPRRVSGYNLDVLNMPGLLNVGRLIAGSEGSLGIITEVTLKMSRILRSTGLCIVHFNNLSQGLHAISTMLAHNPIALEMIDDKIISMGRLAPSTKNKLGWLSGAPQAVIVAEFEAASLAEAQQKTAAFSKDMQSQGIGYAWIELYDPTFMSHVWEVRKSGLGLLLSKRSYSRAIAFLEDISVPPQQLAGFMQKFCSYLKSKGKEAGIYGHVGSGCMHIRPYIDLRQPEELHLMKQMMLDTANLLLEHGGALSGEHGDGLIRSWLNEKMFGPRTYQAFTALKKAFDPENLMNPGKIVYGPPLLQDLRLDASIKQTTIETFLDFSHEGGITLAADLCNGNGQCRKKEKIMCPSFQVTGDEFHTTRARAQALRAVFNGRLPISDYTSHGMYDVLDLCLECKGCKTECPSQVDMAKMKAEFLYHYQKRHGIPLRNQIFANISRINALAYPFATLVNFFSTSRIAKWMANLIGITKERPLPSLAQERFSAWLKKVDQKKKNKKVVLLNDTFNEFHQPQIGKAAIAILQALGYEVIIPPYHCCGRPALSKGLLNLAKSQAANLSAVLQPYAEAGVPIVGLEPSCLLTIKDDFKGLLGKQAEALESACITFDEFMALHVVDGKFPIDFPPEQKQLKLHGHCHQKAIVGMHPTLNLLKAIPSFKVTEIASGCCGMAGSFGYEKEHYAISMKIGELHLFPAIRESPKDSLIVANGFSCRCQIEHGTPRKAYHLAEVLHMHMQTQEKS